jgi:hypothetical protein
MAFLSAVSAVLLEKSRANDCAFVVADPMIEIVRLTCGFAYDALVVVGKHFI